MTDDLGIELPDLRVGVLAARTFDVVDGQFRPIGYVAGNGIVAAWDTWAAADAVARCFIPDVGADYRCPCGCGVSVPSPMFLDYSTVKFKTHAAPAEACTCGLYSFATAQEVFAQYSECARRVLAVVSLEGQALEGSLGWRSERARIIAAWVLDDGARRDLAAQYPTVRFYADGAKILADYPAIDNGTTDGQYPPPPRLESQYFRGYTMQPLNWAAMNTAINQAVVTMGQLTTSLGATLSALQGLSLSWVPPVDDDTLPLATRVERALASGDLASRFHLGTDDRESAPYLTCAPRSLTTEPDTYRPDWASVATIAPPRPSFAKQNRRRLDGTNLKGRGPRG